MQRQFARLYAPDARDRKFAIGRRAPKRRLPRYRYWTEGKAIFQGLTPKCVGFATAFWLACSPVRQYLSPHGLYDLAQIYDEWPGDDYEGSSVRGAMKALEKLGFLREYRWAFHIDAVIESVLTQGPMVVGTEWLEGMDHFDGRGLVKAEGDSYGGHAWVLTGYSRDSQEFRAFTSWKGFGVNKRGRFKIGRDDFADLLAMDGEACLAIERRPAA